MQTPFRIAFVGIDHPHGAGWRELLLNLVPDVEITAIVPYFGGTTASLEERFADLPRYPDADALLLGAEFDGAVICLPNDAGPAIAAQLAWAGKHILVEKPGAAKAADMQEVQRAVCERGVAFQNGYMWRYDEAAGRLRSMVQEGRFGKLISTEMTFVTSDVARRGGDHYLFDAAVSGGGFFNWLACHYLDLLSYITGQSVVGVTARCGCFGTKNVPVDDGGTAILELADGSLATFVGGYWLPRWAGESRWTLRGSERWVAWDPARPGTGGALEIHGPQPQWHPMEETFVLPADKTPGYGGRRGVALLQEWIAAARSGHSCRNTVESTIATLRLIDTIYQASREERRIPCNIGGQ